MQECRRNVENLEDINTFIMVDVDHASDFIQARYDKILDGFEKLQ